MYTSNPNPAPGGLAGLAQQLQSRGRGEDTMLVHMTPKEVDSLQSLATAAGGSLSTNPDTGLPEAGILGSLLPIIAGLGLNLLAPGLGAVASAAIVGGGTTAITGDLGKGLMAGLGAFGGFGLGGALQNMGTAAAQSAAQTGAETLGGGLTAPTLGAPSLAPQSFVPNLAGQAAAAPANAALMPATGAFGMAAPAASTFAPSMGASALPATAAVNTPLAAKLGINSPFVSNFETALGGASGPTALRSGLGAAGLAGGFLGAMQPGMGNMPRGGGGESSAWRYQGPVTAERKAVFPTTAQQESLGSSEFNYFPEPIRYFRGDGQQFTPGTPADPLSKRELKDYNRMYGTDYRYADGGNVNLRDGSFVLDARTVSEVGNGSSSAGQEALARLGGSPIRGPGDGVSDSISANIGGEQRARVARDEVKFDPEAVARLGKGSPSKGAKKLYALMEKAHKARRSAGRGEDTKVRKGLA